MSLSIRGADAPKPASFGRARTTLRGGSEASRSSPLAKENGSLRVIDDADHDENDVYTIRRFETPDPMAQTADLGLICALRIRDLSSVSCQGISAESNSN